MTKHATRLSALVAALLAGLVPAIALANGASVPDSAEFHPESSTPGDLAMNTTFGFLFSTDDGAHWEWTCHEALIGAASLTPKTWRNAGGAFFVAVPLGLGPDPTKALWRTTDRGCNWDPVATISTSGVLAVAFDSTGTVALAAGTNSTVDTARAWISHDSGATFGPPVVTQPGKYFTSARIAPSDSQRLYLTALQPSPPGASIFRSDNQGTSWTEIPFPFVGQAATRLLAVSPTNADVVWLRNDAGTDRVLLSTNGAMSFREILTVDVDVTGFALTNGGATTWVASRATNGVFVATSGAPFERLAGSPAPRCLVSKGDVVYVCADPYNDGFAAASTTDGATWTTAMSFARIGAPRSCPAGSDSATICDPLWPGIDQKIHGASPTPMPSPPPDGSIRKGCRCDLGEDASPPLLASAAALIGLLARRNRRR